MAHWLEELSLVQFEFALHKGCQGFLFITIQRVFNKGSLGWCGKRNTMLVNKLWKTQTNKYFQRKFYALNSLGFTWGRNKLHLPQPAPGLETNPSTWQPSETTKSNGSRHEAVLLPKTVIMLSFTEPLPSVWTMVVRPLFPTWLVQTIRTPLAISAYACVQGHNRNMNLRNPERNLKGNSFGVDTLPLKDQGFMVLKCQFRLITLWKINNSDGANFYINRISQENCKCWSKMNKLAPIWVDRVGTIWLHNIDHVGTIWTIWLHK